MPIRTHRGRAAVYRRLWGWPLRSPKHLLGAVIAVVVVVTVFGMLLPQSPPPDPRTAARTSAAQAQEPVREPAPTSAAPPSFEVPESPPPPSPPDPAGLAMAETWGKAWTNHPAGDKQQWLDGLRPHTTPEFLPEMRSVALANVPTEVTGPPRPVDSTARTVRVRLPTNQGDITITVVDSEQGWRVANYDKAV